MSALIETLTVCLGAVSAIRSLVSVQDSIRLPIPLPASPCAEPWQQSALSLISGVTTIVFAVAGGTGPALVSSAVILAAGSGFTLLVQAHLRGAL